MSTLYNALKCFTVADLKNIAHACGLTVPSRSKKADICTLLQSQSSEAIIKALTSDHITKLLASQSLSTKGNKKAKTQRLLDHFVGTSPQAQQSKTADSKPKRTLTKVPKKQRLLRSNLPSGASEHDFQYKGRSATTQDDFGSDVGIVDMVHININGETSSREFAPDGSNKYYHGGVLQNTQDSSWWVYLEWGTASFSDPSWQNGMFRTEQDGQQCSFQFVPCDDEDDARNWFQAQMRSKNIDRIYEVNGRWTSVQNKDGYIVQSLASRARGLPNATTFTVDAPASKRKSQKKRKQTSVHPKVQLLANQLGGATQSHTQNLIRSGGGIIPTLDTLDAVQNTHLPEALNIIKDNPRKNSSQYKELLGISEYIASLIPRAIPLHPTKQERENAILLTVDTVKDLEQDIDAFRSTLLNGDIFEDVITGVDPSSLFNADIEWISPQSELGRWIALTARGMTRYSRRLTIHNIFSVSRKRVDDDYYDSVSEVARQNKSQKNKHSAKNQPSSRPDLEPYSGSSYTNANVILSFHGTRAVNVQPILSSNLRLPTQLKGVHISGALYGQGIYFATDWGKSASYCGSLSSTGHYFMFFCDVIMGKAHMTKSFGNWMTAPSGTNSVAALTQLTGRSDDEHIIFDPSYQCIRYILEVSF